MTSSSSAATSGAILLTATTGIMHRDTKSSSKVALACPLNHIMSAKLSPMPLWKHAIAYVTLGLLCGWYYFIMMLYPVLLILAVRGSYIAGGVLLGFIILSVVPLKYKVWNGFMYSSIWPIWWEYFGYSGDWSTVTELQAKDKKAGKTTKMVFFEFPHGIFPMGQFLSAYSIRDITPGTMICGTGADIVFMFPVMRHIMAWIGTLPAKRSNMTKILNRGDHLAIIPGGIAEMYLMNKDTEGIFLRKRLNTVKAAIQEGADIVPVFFFGNTRLFNIAGASGSDSLLSKLSRKLRASIVLFYGRHFLPVPLRHPIRMVTGRVVHVQQKEFPSDAEVEEVMQRVITSVQELYDTKKPDWETRPLVIS
jgi:1-acyl-sn-glycerol-3-phosphate acyltransferase